MNTIDGLNPADPGILLLAGALARIPPPACLLVHCGHLPGLGTGTTRLVLDVRELAGSLDHFVLPGREQTARALAPQNGFQAAAVWPRAHLGKDFTHACFAWALLLLAPGGAVYFAARKQKGAQGLADWLHAACGNVERVTRCQGYVLYRATVSGKLDAGLLHQAVTKRYRVESLSIPGVVLASAPGVFARRELDAGTRALIDHVGQLEQLGSGTLRDPPGRVLDVCAGIGPLSLWAATRWPDTRVVAIESNLLAADLLAENAASARAGERVSVVRQDAFSQQGWPDAVDLTLVNPPTHASPEHIEALCRHVRGSTRRGAPAFFVVTRPALLERLLVRCGATVQQTSHGSHTVLEARWP